MRKVVSQYNDSSWVVLSDKRFVYDGWNLVEEQTLSPASSRFYVWGLDVSQSLQGAGGIGGLLATVSGATTDHFLYDGNGNIGQLVNASNGSLDAQYEYDPYGNLILSMGTLSASNPFRFSTKYLDAETGLYYYGYRYYDPKDGRWLTRDPIEEDGGLNLYGFVINNPINYFDFLGLKGVGHHIIPWSIFNEAVQKEVQKFFDSGAARIFNDYYNTHNAKKLEGISAQRYNQLINEEFLQINRGVNYFELTRDFKAIKLR